MGRPLICAELGANHNGSLERALHIIDAAAHAGADAVKLQTWKSGTMVLDREARAPGGPWAGRLLYELYEEAYTPWEWHPTLYAAVRSHRMIPFSSVFDLESIDFLETLDCPMYKIASFEIDDLRLIRAAAKTGKPMVISTGVATKGMVLEAARAAVGNGCKDLTLLHCISEYPAAPEHMAISQMRDLEITFKTSWPVGMVKTKIGLSDHSLSYHPAMAATALGATMIEKHLTLKRSDGGLDAAFSIEPPELEKMKWAINLTYEAVSGERAPSTSNHYKRSLYWANNYPADTPVSDDMVVTARPNLGLSPALTFAMLGKCLKKDVKKHYPVMIDDVGADERARMEKA